MSDFSPRVFGRTQKPVPFLWRSLGPHAFGDASWCAVEIGPDALERKADHVVIDRLAALGRTRCDVLIVQDLLGADLKVGWPTHRLMQLRDRGLCSYFAIETHLPQEAEWMATHAPIHAVIAPFHAADLSLRYRTFEAAHVSGIALITRAATIEDLRLHLATPQICSSIPAFPVDPATVTPLPDTEIETLWSTYQVSNPALPKPRSAHPPEYGA